MTRSEAKAIRKLVRQATEARDEAWGAWLRVKTADADRAEVEALSGAMGRLKAILYFLERETDNMEGTDDGERKRNGDS